MTIREIIHNPKSATKQATVTLDYDEIRDISNLLCKSKVIGKLRSDMFLLFELVKNGCWDKYTLEQALKVREGDDINNLSNEALASLMRKDPSVRDRIAPNIEYCEVVQAGENPGFCDDDCNQCILEWLNENRNLH